MDKRADLAQEMIRGEHSVTELCRKYGVSRPTAYRWKKRFIERGRNGMADCSRRPHESPHRTAQQVEDAVCELRKCHETWGNVKIHHKLLTNGTDGLPSCRTVGRILQRRGCTSPPKPDHEQVAAFEREAPNQLWQMDFKGATPMRPRPQPQRAIPFTIVDDCSRFNIALRVVANHKLQSAWAVLWEAMGVYGMPECILTDNESVFRGFRRGVTGFTAQLWRLGIEHISGRPHHPQTQGKVERLHRTIQGDALKGRVFDTIAQLQAVLDEFRDVYNHQRPHEAIELKVPAEVYRPSDCKRPPEVPQVQYPADAELRRVSNHGFICMRNCRVNVGEGIIGEHVRIHERGQTFEIEYAGHILRCVAWDDLATNTWI